MGSNGRIWPKSSVAASALSAQLRYRPELLRCPTQMNSARQYLISKRIDALVEQMPELVADNLTKPTSGRLRSPLRSDHSGCRRDKRSGLRAGKSEARDVLVRHGKLGQAIPQPSDPKTVSLEEWLRQTTKIARKRAF